MSAKSKLMAKISRLLRLSLGCVCYSCDVMLWWAFSCNHGDVSVYIGNKGTTGGKTAILFCRCAMTGHTAFFIQHTCSYYCAHVVITMNVFMHIYHSDDVTVYNAQVIYSVYTPMVVYPDIHI